jgi:hypothetical protein
MNNVFSVDPSRRAELEEQSIPVLWRDEVIGHVDDDLTGGMGSGNVPPTDAVEGRVRLDHHLRTWPAPSGLHAVLPVAVNADYDLDAFRVICPVEPHFHSRFNAARTAARVVQRKDRVHIQFFNVEQISHT